ncbi:techylectin-5A-like [Oratosquilla oratoria]|uniref:techylectin-5A-like n=1 Tax=Oratosquilla oratoria TaxID=337810 RepID=UPI003F761771
MLKVFTLWLLCLVLASAATSSVPVEVDLPVERLEQDVRHGPVQAALIRSLTQCSDHVVTLSSLVADLTKRYCSAASSSEGCRDENNPKLKKDCLPPVDCHDLLLLGHNTSGVYDIYPSRDQRSLSIKVYCDMDAGTGGWTVFLMRKEQKVQENFTRTWEEYSKGFGNPEDEHWLGNDLIHAMTNTRKYVLRADMEDFEGTSRWAEYDTFNVGSKAALYPLTVSGYSGDAGDDMKSQNGQKFSTEENDNDSHTSNCAKTYKGGWWYGGCHATNPTGLYLKGKHDTYAIGVNWKSFKGYHYSLKTLSLKIRPREVPAFVHHSL